MKQTELAEPHLAPPSAEQAAGNHDAAVSAQHVLDAIAQAVSLEPGAGFSALAPVEVTRDVAVMVRRRSKDRRPADLQSAVSEEQEVRDSLAAATAELKLAVRNVRDQYVRLADVEIRKTLGVEAEARPVRRRGTRDATLAEGPSAPSAPASGAEAPGEAAWTPRASAPGELYEGTVHLLVMAGGDVQQIVQFVDELCQMPQFRMLRMTGSRQQDGAEISLGLREPLPLAKIVASMPNVVSVDVASPYEAAADGGIDVTVYLAPAEEGGLEFAELDPPIQPEA